MTVKMEISKKLKKMNLFLENNTLIIMKRSIRITLVISML